MVNLTSPTAPCHLLLGLKRGICPLQHDGYRPHRSIAEVEQNAHNLPNFSKEAICSRSQESNRDSNPHSTVVVYFCIVNQLLIIRYKFNPFLE